jgi:glucose-1-phosphate adenylyltransferase
MPKVISIILGGGKGTRLFPLTKVRSKPAVPFGGKYRIIDVPVSNCINSGFNQIYLLTQFNSASLHLHINSTYVFDRFSKGYVEILAAEQTPERSTWFEGTADAVRKNIHHFKSQHPTHYIILSGDQLYRMDLAAFLDNHIKNKAEISIATTAVNRFDASDFGIMKVNSSGLITEFMEKPGKTMNIDAWKIPAAARSAGLPAEKEYLANMGIYIFDAAVMHAALDNDLTDFGKEVLPQELTHRRVMSFIHQGYWEDIGTIRSFFEANIALTALEPPFSVYDEVMPIWTAQTNLPPSKINKSEIQHSVTCEGCVITVAKIKDSVIGVRSVIEKGAELDRVVFMGADYYEGVVNVDTSGICLGIGENCKVRNTIIDKNARIGANCSIGMSDTPYGDVETDAYQIVDGIIVIKKDAVIPAGTRI